MITQTKTNLSMSQLLITFFASHSFALHLFNVSIVTNIPSVVAVVINIPSVVPTVVKGKKRLKKPLRTICHFRF